MCRVLGNVKKKPSAGSNMPTTAVTVWKSVCYLKFADQLTGIVLIVIVLDYSDCVVRRKFIALALDRMENVEIVKSKKE